MRRCVVMHPKFCERMAKVFLEKHHVEGHEAAQQWYSQNVPPADRIEVRKAIMDAAKRHTFNSTDKPTKET